MFPKIKLKAKYSTAFGLIVSGFLLMGNAFAQKGQLILFTSQSDLAVTKDFEGNVVEKLKAMAAAQQVEVKLVQVDQGAPQEIAFTPAIIFQNHLGRSLYVGRYHYVDKVKTFMRSVRRLPQTETTNEKHDVLIAQQGRLTVVNPIKITPLDGTKPGKHDEEKFRKEAIKALDEGMKEFSFQEHFLAKRNHRLVYTAFYPYRSEDGRFFVSAEMYSQFNCVTPVYKQFDLPFEGSWKDWNKVFQEAGRSMAIQIGLMLTSASNGDGLVALPADLPVRSWDEMGLSLPAPDQNQATQNVTVPDRLPLEWEIAGPAEKDLPMIAFAFPSPLDYYAGELGQFSGNLKLGADADISKATGLFSVQMESLTMGDPDLDHSVAGMLKFLDYPQSSFRFGKILKMENPMMKYGNSTQILVEGNFAFMGIDLPLQVEATLEPTVDDAGALRMLANAQFQIRLKEKYNVKGPDGPPDASDTVVFNLNFLLKAVG